MLKRKMGLKWLSAFAVLGLLLGIMAGCQGGTEQPTTAGPTTKQEAAADTTAEAPKKTEAPEETEAPKTEAPEETEAPETEAPETEAPETEAPETEAPETEAAGDPTPVTIWYTIGRFTIDERTDQIPREEDLGFLEEKFNIKLDFVTSPGDQARDQLGILLSTNSMPDIVATPGAYDTFLIRPDQLFTDGQIIDLGTVIDQIPTYKSIIDENPVLMKNVMDDEGHILYFGMPIFEAEIGMSGGLMLRRDWVDKLDMEMPQSIDDFLDILRAFRDQDPNGNGEADEIPFCGTQGSLQVIGNLLGVQETFSMVGGSGGQVVFGPFEEELYRERLKLIRTMVEEKLINENYYNFDMQMRDTWISEDRIGAALTGLGNLDKWNNLMADHESFLMWPFDNPAQEDGNRYFDRTDLSKAMRHDITMISTNAIDPGVCAALLDYFYTDEGHMLQTFGVEGLTYEMDGDFPSYTDLILHNPDGLGVGDAQGKYIGIPGARTYEDLRVWAQLSLTTPASRQAAMKTWTDTFTEETNTPIPPAMMTVDDADEYATIMADLQTYLLESVAKFTTGEWDIDTQYDAFVEECRVLGAERALELQDIAIKAWQERGGVPYEFTLQRAEIDWSKIPFLSERGIEYMDPSLR